MRTARLVFAGLAWLFVACLVIQVFLAGLGVFRTAADFDTHRNFAFLFGWLTLIMLVLALVARLGRRLVGLTALTLVLFALQSVLVGLRGSTPELAALHPLNGFLLLFVAIRIALDARVALRQHPGAEPATTPATSEA